MNREVRSPRGNLLFPTVLIATIALGLTLAQVLTTPEVWWGWSPSIVLEVGGSLLWVWVAAAATAAWATLPLVASSAKDLPSQRRQGSPVKHVLRIVGGVGLVATLVALLVPLSLSMAATGFQSRYFPQVLLWLLSYFAFTLVCALLGIFAASLLKNYVAVLVGAAAVYALTTLPNYTLSQPFWSILAPYHATSWTTGSASISQATLRLIFWVFVAAALSYLVVGLRRTSAHWATGAGLAFVAVGIVGAHQVPAPDMAIHCVTVGPTNVCQSEPYAAGLGSFSDVVEEALERVPEDLVPTEIWGDVDISLYSSLPGTPSAHQPDDGRALVVEPSSRTSRPTNLPSREETLVRVYDALLTPVCTPEAVEDSTAQTGEAGRDVYIEDLAWRAWWKESFGLDPNRQYGYGDVGSQYLDPQLVEQATLRASELRDLDPAQRAEMLVERVRQPDCRVRNAT